MKGKVYLVGAGPGDAGLITEKGLRLMREADTVVYDRLVGLGILSQLRPDCRRIDVGKTAGRHPVPQEEINRILLREAEAGRLVVRLKGGDPFLFGRGGEELELLRQHGIPFEVVPGVASALAVPAYGGIPVTHRELASSVHIITGHQKQGEPLRLDFPRLAGLEGTLVFLMGLAALEEIAGGLMGAGLAPDTPAAVIASGTTASQRQVCAPLGQLAARVRQAGLESPAVIVIGGTAALAERFSWRESLPLAGLRVAVTRPRAVCSRLARRLEALGAEVLQMPAIETRPIWPNQRLEAALAQLAQYQWLAFTSAAGVEAFLDGLWRLGGDLRALAGKRLAAIGPGTARALKERFLRVDLIPEEYNSLHLAQGLIQRMQPGERLLLPRASQGSPVLAETLGRAGVAFEEVPLYETLPAPAAPEPVTDCVRRGGIDWALFASASSVRAFAGQLGGETPAGLRALCIGAQTAAAAESAGMRVTVSPQATIDSMIDTLLLEVKKKEGDPR